MVYAQMWPKPMSLSSLGCIANGFTLKKLRTGCTLLIYKFLLRQTFNPTKDIDIYKSLHCSSKVLVKKIAQLIAYQSNSYW